jgi:3'(2'),5'-bisphosphate nucleotidase
MAYEDDVASELCEIALQAGAAILRHYHEGTNARLKSDASPVTAADEEAEAIILQALAQRFSRPMVLAEESVARDGLPAELADDYFLVDPLDGTREFLARNGEFTVNIALMRQDAPVAGVVYAPALGLIFWGGGEAHRAQLPHGTLHLPRGDKIRCRPAAAPLCALESRSHISAADKEAVSKLGPHLTRPLGSSLKFGFIASGEADVTLRLGPTMEWDTAAGDAVLRAAGGMTFTAEGEVMRYGKLQQGLRNGAYAAWGEPALGQGRNWLTVN